MPLGIGKELLPLARRLTRSISGASGQVRPPINGLLLRATRCCARASAERWFRAKSFSRPRSGEICVKDPDGYVVLVGHWGKSEHEEWEKRLEQKKKDGAQS